MILSAMIRKRQPANVATATLATFATLEGEKVRTVASVATVAVANPETPQADAVAAEAMAESFKLGATEAAPDEPADDRRTCRECQNRRGRVCTVAKPGGLVSANRGYQPNPDTLQRCAGYLPNDSDTDQRTGLDRWPGMSYVKGSK